MSAARDSPCWGARAGFLEDDALIRGRVVPDVTVSIPIHRLSPSSHHETAAPTLETMPPLAAPAVVVVSAVGAPPVRPRAWSLGEASDDPTGEPIATPRAPLRWLRDLVFCAQLEGVVATTDHAWDRVGAKSPAEVDVLRLVRFVEDVASRPDGSFRARTAGAVRRVMSVFRDSPDAMRDWLDRNSSDRRVSALVRRRRLAVSAAW